jgi:hypothetical protein
MFDLFGSGLLATMVGLYHYSKQIGELKHQAKYIKKGTKRDHHDYGESFYKLAKELVISQMHRNGVTEVISEDQPWNWTEPA